MTSPRDGQEPGVSLTPEAEETLTRIVELVAAAGVTGMTPTEVFIATESLGIQFDSLSGPRRLMSAAVSRGLLVGPDVLLKYYGAGTVRRSGTSNGAGYRYETIDVMPGRPASVPRYVTDDQFAVISAVRELRGDGEFEDAVWYVVVFRHDVREPETAYAVLRVHWHQERGRYIAYDGDYDLTLAGAMDDMLMRSGLRKPVD